MTIFGLNYSLQTVSIYWLFSHRISIATPTPHNFFNSHFVAKVLFWNLKFFYICFSFGVIGVM